MKVNDVNHHQERWGETFKSLTLNSVELAKTGQRPNNFTQGPQCIMQIARRRNTTKFIIKGAGVSYFPRNGPIVYAMRRGSLSFVKSCGQIIFYIFYQFFSSVIVLKDFFAVKTPTKQS